MQRKASFAVVSALAAATAATPATATSHTSIAATLASYMPQIEAVQDAHLKSNLLGLVKLLNESFEYCATKQGHSPEFYTYMQGQLAEIAGLLNHNPEQTQIALAEARAIDGIDAR